MLQVRERRRGDEVLGKKAFTQVVGKVEHHVAPWMAQGVGMNQRVDLHIAQAGRA